MPAYIGEGKAHNMTDNSAKTLFGQSPKRYGVASIGAACLAFASWPLMVVIGFVMVYVAALLAFFALVSGLMGVGSGIYYKEAVGVATGALCLGLARWGIGFVASARTYF